MKEEDYESREGVKPPSRDAKVMMGDILAQREQILAAFIAEMGLKPSECEQVMQGSKWWVQKRSENLKCICYGNFRNIVTFHLIGEKFEDTDTDGKIYTYFGVVYSDDDLYYGMLDIENKCLLLSCVCSIETAGFKKV